MNKLIFRLYSPLGALAKQLTDDLISTHLQTEMKYHLTSNGDQQVESSSFYWLFIP